MSDVGLWHSLGASEPRVNRLIVPAGSGVVTVELMGRLRESWQSRAHTGRNQVSQEYKVELMYRFDVDQQKLDNYNNKYCSSNGIVRSGTCIAKKTFGNSNGRVRDV